MEAASLRLVQRSIAAGDVAAARVACDELLASSPSDPRSMHCDAVLSLIEGDAAAARGRTAAAQSAIIEAVAKAKACVAARPAQYRFHMTLGRALQRSGGKKDAVAAFSNATRLSPSTATFHALAAAQGMAKQCAASARSYNRALLEIAPDSPLEKRVSLHYAHGQALKRSGDRKAAARAFGKALKLDPSHASSAFKLASLLAADGDGRVPTARVARAPASYVARLFDDYASTFEAHLTTHLQYQTPSELAADVALLFPGRRWPRALDLGCGTGLSGAPFESTVDEMVGIDLSAAMIAQCREMRGIPATAAGGDGGGKSRRALYSRLFVGDILAAPMLLGESTAPFDLVLCCDTLVYIGALEPVFEMLAALVSTHAAAEAPPAVFACSCELLPGSGDNEPFRLLRTKRFAHRREYVESTAIAHGWSVRSMRESQIRMNKGVPIVGLLCVFSYSCS